MGQLVTYEIDEKKEGIFKLTFTAIANTEVSYSYDRKTNINTVTLTTGKNNKTKFSNEYKKINGKLHISFNQVNSTLRSLGSGEPVIIVEDDN